MDHPPASEAESAKTKYRPQQSCLQCRERKVKCDRAKPCQACCIRGLQAECEYVSNNEDRYQISQADIIDTLRKKVGRLKRRLADVEQSSPSSADTEPDELSAASPRPRKAQRRTSDVPGGVPYDYYHVGQLPVAQASVPPTKNFSNHGLNPPPHGHHQNGNTYQSTSMQPPRGHPATVRPGYHDMYDRDVKLPAIDLEISPAVAHPRFLNSDIHHQLQHRQMDFWKGKQGLLQVIYKIICDCDDARIPFIIDIVRNSMSPEEALVSIRRLLNLSLSPTASSSVPSDSDGAPMGTNGGTVLRRLGPFMTSSSESHSPEQEESALEFYA